jgi:hypothetical protein
LKSSKQFKKKGKANHGFGTSTWTAPPLDWMKINTGAYFSENTKSGGWGAICRDDTPDIQFDVDGHLEMITDAMHAEAMAMSNAIQVAEQLGVGRAIFETNCSNLQTTLVSLEYDYAPLGVLISELKV